MHSILHAGQIWILQIVLVACLAPHERLDAIELVSKVYDEVTMEDTEAKIAELQNQITTLNDQIQLPGANIPEINKQIRALMVQQNVLRTGALKEDLDGKV